MFEKPKFEKPVKKEEIPEETKDFIKSGGEEIKKELDQLEKKGILEKIRSGKFGSMVKRLAFVLMFLASTEAFAQTKETPNRDYEASLEHTKAAVLYLDQQARTSPDKSGIEKIGDKEEKFFEKRLPGTVIHTNDDYLYVKKLQQKKDGSFNVVYVVDQKKDGQVDQIVLVPIKDYHQYHQINFTSAEEAAIKNEFTDVSPEERVLMKTVDMSKSALKDRRVWMFMGRDFESYWRGHFYKDGKEEDEYGPNHYSEYDLLQHYGEAAFTSTALRFVAEDITSGKIQFEK